METVDLSKPNLCTACVLLLAPQQFWPKPRRNKTWTRWKWSLCSIHFFELCLNQLLNFAVFLKLSIFLTWLLWTSLSGEGEIRSDLCECISLTTEENPPRLTIGQRWMGIHAFVASQKRVLIWWSIGLASILALGDSWAADAGCMDISGYFMQHLSKFLSN